MPANRTGEGPGPHGSLGPGRGPTGAGQGARSGGADGRTSKPAGNRSPNAKQGGQKTSDSKPDSGGWAGQAAHDREQAAKIGAYSAPESKTLGLSGRGYTSDAERRNLMIGQYDARYDNDLIGNFLAGMIGVREKEPMEDPEYDPAIDTNARWGADPVAMALGALGAITNIPFGTGYWAGQQLGLIPGDYGQMIDLGPDVLGGVFGDNDLARNVSDFASGANPVRGSDPINAFGGRDGGGNSGQNREPRIPGSLPPLKPPKPGTTPTVPTIPIPGNDNLNEFGDAVMPRNYRGWTRYGYKPEPLFFAPFAPLQQPVDLTK